MFVEFSFWDSFLFLEMSSYENMSRRAVCLKSSEQLKSWQTRNTFLGGGQICFIFTLIWGR